jgi:chloramphenicol 3-O phosphotransferase
MSPTAFVLNGPSGCGKSTIAAGLQAAWRAPLQASGIDTFLAIQSESFFAIDGSLIDGFSWVPSVVDGAPAYEVVPGELGIGMIRASHAYWAATVEAGMDQVIDDVWLVDLQPSGLAEALAGAHVVWVGVRCSLDVLEERERERGDRLIGTVRGHYDLVHSFRSYDLEVDTATSTADECVAAILASPAEPAQDM